MSEEKKPGKAPAKKAKAGGVHAGHRKRMRERFYKTGLDGFEDHEVVELLLYYTIRRRNVNETAHLLLNRFGSLAGVLDAPVGELLRVPGVGDTTANFLTLIPQVITQLERQMAEAKTIFIHSPEDIEELAAATLRQPLNRKKVLFAFISPNDLVLDTYLLDRFTDLNIRDLAYKFARSGAPNCLIVERVEDNTLPVDTDQLQALNVLAEQLKTLTCPLMDYYTVDDLGHPPRSFVKTGQLLLW